MRTALQHQHAARQPQGRPTVTVGGVTLTIESDGVNRFVLLPQGTRQATCECSSIWAASNPFVQSIHPRAYLYERAGDVEGIACRSCGRTFLIQRT